jgi:hypothetical protein
MYSPKEWTEHIQDVQDNLDKANGLHVMIHDSLKVSYVYGSFNDAVTNLEYVTSRM